MPVTVGANFEPIPGYRLIERLGRGGFGEVWKAEAPGGLHKAIKFVYGDLAATGDGEPAEQELKSLERVKSIRHPYILSLERYDIVDGQLVIVMELADRNLWDRFRECRAEGLLGIPRAELLDYLDEAAEALDLMNTNHQLQHLDIKPQNLFLVYNHVKIADFGLVKDFEGKRGTITGGVTPVYAAPETFDGWVSRHSDQYSLAIVFQELLTGQRPFTGTTAGQLLLQHLQSPPELSPLPENDRAVIARSLAKRPDDRYPSCSELVDALKSAGASPPTRVPVSPGSSDATVGPAEPLVSTPGRENGSIYSQSVVGRPSSAALFSAPYTHVRSAAAATRAHPKPEALLLPLGAGEGAGVNDGGVLVPAVIVGAGGVGGQVVRLFRSALHQRFGTADLPHIRLLVVDTDPAALKDLTNGHGAGLTPEEVVHAGMGRPSYYLRNESTRDAETWLKPGTLYRLPRNPGPALHRPFGRLAFSDHAAAIARRLAAELEACGTAEALEAAKATTGFEVRARVPRVYVVAGLTGGTGGGMFLDLAYLARAILGQTVAGPQRVAGLLLVPPPSRPGHGPSNGTVNTYASLSELRHYSRPDTTYLARFEAKGPFYQDDGAPFHSCMLLPLASEGGTDDCKKRLGQASGWLVRELLSPVGGAAESARDVGRLVAATLFAGSAASVALTCPTGPLTRQAAVVVARDLIHRWAAKDEARRLHDAVFGILDEEWDRRGLSPERLAERLNAAAQEAIGQPIADRVEKGLAPFVSGGPDGKALDMAAAEKAVNRIIKLVGRPVARGTEDAAVGQVFAGAAQAIAQACEQQVTDIAIDLIDRPDLRLAGAEEALRQTADRVASLVTTYTSLSDSLNQEATEVLQHVYTAVTGLERRVPGIRRRDAVLSDVAARMRDFAKKRYQGLLAAAIRGMYQSIAVGVPELMREVQSCRERLGVAADECGRFNPGPTNADVAAGPQRFLLPGGVATLDEAARRFADGLSPEQWLELDRRVHARLKANSRSVAGICLASQQRTDQLVDLLRSAAEEFVDTRLTRADPAEALLSNSEALDEILAEAVDASVPPLAGPRASNGSLTTLLGVPNTPAGQKIRELAESVDLGVRFVATETSGEILVQRELWRLDFDALPQMGTAARTAYLRALAEDGIPPHSRNDVRWPTPKEPIGVTTPVGAK